MSWYSTNDSFPAAVQEAALPAGTVIQEQYVLEKPLRVSGLELTYLARDTRTQQPLYLRELLPMRWCMRGEDGCWTPYHAEAESLFSAVKARCIAQMEHLQMFSEESAVEQILAVFEAGGTVWIAAEYVPEQTLAEAIAAKLFTPQEAIELLTPVMDTLVGLHEEKLCHGSISAYSVMLREDTAVLTGWYSGIREEPLTTEMDVSAVSELLYRMMTGEQTYIAETAAELPRGIRKALKKGMEKPSIGMVQLWKLLHADKPSRRSVRMQRHTSGSSGFGKLFSPLFTVIFCILCCAVPVSLIAAGNYAGQLRDVSYTLSDEEIRVPEFLYLTQEDAVQEAEALGLHVIIAAREDNPVIQENLVITQKPNAGAVLKAGDTVQLVISDGWRNFVPNVCNMLLEDAVAELERLGFVVTYEEILSVGDAPGSVITQSIEPDTNLKRDSNIHLQVSLGRDDLDVTKLETVGNYVGLEFEEAKLMLAELHLYALQVEAVYDPVVPEGFVISQEIPEGRRVSQGTIINMVVSRGVETVRVPRVALMNVNSARAALEQARLKAVVIYAADGGFAADTVISQGTAYNSIVPVGSEVWLTVSTGRGNTVISTGGWSGAPLPTVETMETDESETQPSETIQSETLPTETDMTETKPQTLPTESSTQSTPRYTQPVVTVPVQPTVPPTAPTSASTEQPTEPDATDDAPAPTDPPETQAPTDPPETAAPLPTESGSLEDEGF